MFVFVLLENQGVLHQKVRMKYLETYAKEGESPVRSNPRVSYQVN